MFTNLRTYILQFLFREMLGYVRIKARGQSGEVKRGRIATRGEKRQRIKTRPQRQAEKMCLIKIRLLYVRSAVGFTVPYIIAVSCRNFQRQPHRTPRLGILSPFLWELHLQRRRPQFQAVTKFAAEHRQSIPETRRDERASLFVKYY